MGRSKRIPADFKYRNRSYWSDDCRFFGKELFLNKNNTIGICFSMTLDDIREKSTSNFITQRFIIFEDYYHFYHEELETGIASYSKKRIDHFKTKDSEIHLLANGLLIIEREIKRKKALVMISPNMDIDDEFYVKLMSFFNMNKAEIITEVLIGDKALAKQFAKDYIPLCVV